MDHEKTLHQEKLERSELEHRQTLQLWTRVIIAILVIVPQLAYCTIKINT